MNWTSRIPLLIGATVLIGPAASCEDSFVESAPRSEITVLVFNYANLPDGELRQAADLATVVFRRAGVSLTWLRCRPSSGNAISNRMCGRPLRPTDLILNILDESMTERMGRSDSCFGYAIRTKSSFSRLAGVHGDQALDLERRFKIPRPRLLGIFMAHEIGHLLLPDGRHSEDGIMRASWSPSALRRAATGRVGFSSRQAQFIRRNVYRRKQGISVPPGPVRKQ